MRKQEIADLMIRLFGCTDQAGIQDDVEKLMKAAPTAMQIEFINMLIEDPTWDREPDDDDIKVARSLVGFEDNPKEDKK